MATKAISAHGIQTLNWAVPWVAADFCLWVRMWKHVSAVWVMIHGATEAATYQPEERQRLHESSSLIFSSPREYTHTHTKQENSFQHSLSQACAYLLVYLLHLVGLRWRWWKKWPRPVLHPSALPPELCTKWSRWGPSAGTAGWSWTRSAPLGLTLHRGLHTTACNLPGGGVLVRMPG